jgi:hypothetical protein
VCSGLRRVIPEDHETNLRIAEMCGAARFAPFARSPATRPAKNG